MNVESDLAAAREHFLALRESFRKSTPRSINYVPRSAVHYQEAKISSRLVESIKKTWQGQPQSDKRRTLCILGNDGEYVKRGSSVWAKFIKEAAQSENTYVKYAFLEPTEEAISELLKIRDQVGKDRLVLLKSKSPKAIAPEAKAVFDQCKTHHFVFGENPRLLWLEGHHEEMQVVATDCVYFDTDVCFSSPEWHIYENTFKNKIEPNLVPIP